MKLYLAFLLSLISYVLLATPTNEKNHLIENEVFDFSKDLISERLEIISDEIPFTYHPDIEKFLKSYTTTGIRQAQALIGKKDIYFPMIEHYLWIYDMPESLKYVAMVESKLRPTAVSKSGAVGLWQFMHPTAVDYGLKINRYVDERKDPIKSTEAAVLYLNDLHDEFDDWLLAIAAYNCGPSNVRRAIRNGRSRDFWKIRKYLPRQTQKYIPAIIAAGYISNYYDYHNIEPRVPEYGQEIAESIKVYERLTFKEIAARTGISTEILYKLNPSYRKGVIPQGTAGNYLVLPQSVMHHFEMPPPYMKIEGREKSYRDNAGQDMIKSSYTVVIGDQLENLAQLFKCTTRQIQRWNQLPTPNIIPGQTLVLYFPKTVLD